jgi:hypothetical protein
MRMWLTSFSDHHWDMGSVYKTMIKSNLEVNVSTGQDSNNCWIESSLKGVDLRKEWGRKTEQMSN